jgi:HAD superfamily hydrolase (TIGR01509 family)
MRDTILWDHDGVLVDTERCYFEATAEVLARIGVTLSLEQYRQFHLVEARGSWHLAGDLPGAEIETLRTERNALYTRMITGRDVLVPGAIDLLKRLKPYYRMAIVTSAWREHFEAIHRTSGLKDQVAFVLAHEDYTRSKPDPEPYLAAMARFGAAKDRCLAVEDSARGLAAARGAGIGCWMVYSEMTAGLCFDGAERRFDSLMAAGEALVAAAPRAV